MAKGLSARLGRLEVTTFFMENNPDFLIVPFLLIQDKDLSPLDREVYGIVYWYSRLKLEKCIASSKTIAEKLNASEGGIQNSINKLVLKGYIERTYDRITHIRELTPLVTYAKSTTSNNAVAPHQMMLGTTSDNVVDSINNNIEKEKKKVYTSELSDIVSYWNTQLKTRYKSIDTLLPNFIYWREHYSVQEIKRAIDFIPYHDFWSDKMTPSILFRKKNPQQQPVNYINQLLDIKKVKRKEGEGQMAFLQRLGGWKKLNGNMQI